MGGDEGCNEGRRIQTCDERNGSEGLFERMWATNGGSVSRRGVRGVHGCGGVGEGGPTGFPLTRGVGSGFSS